VSVIRPAQAADQEQIVSIMSEPTFGDFMMTRRDRAMATELVRVCLEHSLSGQPLHFLVAGSDEVQGFGISRLGADKVWDIQIGVAEKFRGRQLGQALVSALLEAAKARGPGAARAVIHPDNVGSVKMTSRFLPRTGPFAKLHGFDEFYVAW
jgi:ribosomal protein S18 acetylase RimI-like enzyme